MLLNNDQSTAPDPMWYRNAVIYQAHVRSFYKDLIDTQPVLSQGYAMLPKGPGLGTRLNPERPVNWW